jgi:hypothetical protein
MEEKMSLQQREAERYREALEREQESSYQLLSDVHKATGEVQVLRDQLEEKLMEIRHLREENKRQIERAREVELENEKLQKDQQYVVHRSD